MNAGCLVLQVYNDELRWRTRALLDPAHREAANREEFERTALRMLQPRRPVEPDSSGGLPPLLRRTGRLRKQLDKVERVVTRCGRVACVMAQPWYFPDKPLPDRWCDMVAAGLRDREDIEALVEQLYEVMPLAAGWQCGLVRVAELMGVELPVITLKLGGGYSPGRTLGLRQAGFRVQFYMTYDTFVQMPGIPLLASDSMVAGKPWNMSLWYPGVWLFVAAVRPDAWCFTVPWQYRHWQPQIVRSP